ncbi:hypothetical protein PR048_021971 [Dryococelus australis]|uniref:Retrovirus-related Pol polyprotein from transposon TNT 1-94-like beta-barrel domain-containing protein n=1 Tax=Dryococelus australis TaxID=614101 RepID=A0ABQ9GZP2_9NEOP|nr:hypothetical protein PR048_021971 [Dryococelus australis]
MHLQERISDEASALTAKMKPKLYVSKKTVNTKGHKCLNFGKVGCIKKYCPEDSSRDKTIAYSLGSGNRNHSSKSKNVALLTALNILRKNLNEWYVDSGATSHMTPRKDWLIDFKDDSHIKVTVAKDESVLSEGVGNV